MTPRLQRTIRRPAQVSGFGLFSSADVSVCFHPAPEHHGIAFQRIDLPQQPRVPALVRYVRPGLRRTLLQRGTAQVQVVEHLLAALAGLQIDNCLVQLDASEPPGCDGSADAFTQALLDAGIREQSASRRICRINQTGTIELPERRGRIEFAPPAQDEFKISFEVDYPHPAIGQQTCSTHVSPSTFVRDLSFARTFVLDTEVEAMRSQGFGVRATTSNLILFGVDGPIDTTLRTDNECARHKLLDCLGDFALLGCDIVGRIHCHGSGHAHNHELVRNLEQRLRANSRLAAAG